MKEKLKNKKERKGLLNFSASLIAIVAGLAVGLIILLFSNSS